MNTLEGNKLIASFMGAVDGFIHYTGQGEDMVYSIQETKYRTSWDWLMPCVIMCKENQLFGSQHLIDRIDAALLFGDIEATYKAVLSFIEWYNYTQQ